MRCMRCQGLMVWDRFLDLAQTDRLWALAWRCVNCGEVLDAVIQSHRISARLLREPVQELQTAAMKSKGKQAKSFSPPVRHTLSVSEPASPSRVPDNDDRKAARKQSSRVAGTNTEGRQVIRRFWARNAEMLQRF